jgi:hexosaminidase
MHLDVGRHFFPVSFIKKYIDYLALHKFNTFHWHLTEDQGWRIQIKKYPKLTQVGAWRNGTIIGRYPGTGNDGIKYGGFYTQEQIKEIVKYAADRYITVVPEIEMPGHSSAAIAAYPELSCFPDEPTKNYFPKQCAWSGDSTGKQVQQTWGVFDDVFCAGEENTFKFLEDVMDEVLALFPSKYIHVGGDECPKENWKRCPQCQKRMKDNNLKDEHELQSYFIQRMEKYLNKKGRILIGWDEILEGGLAPNAVVMSWRGETGGIEAAKQNHDVIMTPGNPVYFDHTQSENEDSVTIGGFNPIEKVYAYEPVPKELNDEQAKHVLGAQANMWTEYMKNTKKVEYMLFPRIAALSEVLWSKKENKNWDDFQKRLMVQFKRYDLWKVNYSKAYFDLKATILPSEKYPDALKWKLESKIPDATIYYKMEGAQDGMGEFRKYIEPIEFKWPIMVAYASNEKTKIYSNEIWQSFHFNKATGKKITLSNPASDKYPGDGPFTLVNGVINEKGFARSKEFLGFNGTNCEAVIDLGKEETIKFVKINFLDQRSSWIYPPRVIDIYLSSDGVKFERSPNEDRAKEVPGKIYRYMHAGFYPRATARYIKVVIKNFGTIPEGNPGASNKSWLFVDEIEVNTPNL